MSDSPHLSRPIQALDDPPPVDMESGPKPTRSFSYQPPETERPVPQRKPTSLYAPRKPRQNLVLGFGNPSGGLPSPGRKALREMRESKKNAEQEEQLEEIKRRMGTLMLSDRKFQLKRGDIESIGRIGSGISGEVFCVKFNPTGTIMAAKTPWIGNQSVESPCGECSLQCYWMTSCKRKMVWLDDNEERKRILMDLRVMTSHRSPHIVQYYGSVIWNNDVWVFMELMATCLDRLLKKLKNPFPEEIVCKMTVSIVKALDYLKNEHQVIHRDVKPSNILLDRWGNIKLCDFGISGRLVDSQAFTRNAGCAAYMAPERIKLQSGKKGYDVRADIWSLGMSLVELATGGSPYNSVAFSTEFELLTHIVDAPPPLPDKSKFSTNFYNFIAQCLTKDVEKRPHYSELLTHPLILEYETKSVDIGQWYQEVCKTHGPP